jgi:murein DD-endopeptidase MepM/ murein hydrolase activator NlpD
MSKPRFRGAIPVALLAAFAAGAAIDGWLRTNGPPKPVTTGAAVDSRPAPSAVSGRRDNRDPTPPDAFIAAPPKVGTAAPVATTGDMPRGRLRVPIDGEDIELLKGGFAERRDAGGRPHEAVDILAPRNTPVHAVEDGTIAKLFTSKAGGLTVYQFDSTGHLCYYYAHLERYADGLKDGQTVSQGDVIGYVGTTGNAPANTPHLHFAVFEMNADKHWWQGKPLDPYQVFKDRG